MAYAMQVGAVPDCCGAIVLHRLFKNTNPKVLTDWSPQEQAYYKIDQAYVDTWNRNHASELETEEQWLNRIRSGIQAKIETYTNKRSYLLVTLNPKEQALESILLELGFRVLVPETKNPNGSSITMYIYYLLKEAQPQASILKKA